MNLNKSLVSQSNFKIIFVGKPNVRDLVIIDWDILVGKSFTWDLTSTEDG